MSPTTAQAASSIATRGPGRPRAFDTEQVLELALEHFWRAGLKATTRDLERVLGLSQSSIYNAFGSKQKLLDAALDRYEERADAALLPPLRDTPDGIDGIQRFFTRLHDWISSDGRRGCMLINLMAEDGGESPALVARSQRYRQRVRNALRDTLQRAAHSGETFATDIESRADLLMCMVLGFNIATRGGGSAEEQDRLLASVRMQVDSWRTTAGTD